MTDADTIQFAAEDVALAIEDMIEAGSGDIQYVSQTQMSSDLATLTSGVRQRVMVVARLHGVNAYGSAASGDPTGAEAIKRAVARYERDPDAYIDEMARDEDRDEDAAQNAAEDKAQPFVAAPAAAPTYETAQALVVAPKAPSPVAPATKAPIAPPQPVVFVDRAMKTVFPNVSGEYATIMVPTAKWGQRKPTLPEPDAHYRFGGFAVRAMASAMRLRKNVIAYGDPGCGKTEFFKQFAARIGMPYAGITFDGQVSRTEIVGSFRQVCTPEGSSTPFVDGLIPTLIQRPGILCLNEIDQCDPDIQYILHDIYEGGGMTIQEDGGRFVPRHPDCYLVATANTKGRGSDDGLTHARHDMSEATRDRYAIWLGFTYMKESDEIETIVAKTDLHRDQAGKLVQIGQAIRNAYKTGNMSQPCSLRQLLDAAVIAKAYDDGDAAVGLAIAVKLVLIGRANQHDSLQIEQFVVQTLAIDLSKMEF